MGKRRKKRSPKFRPRENEESAMWREYDRIMRSEREKKRLSRKQVIQPQLDTLIARRCCHCYNPDIGHHRIFTPEGCFDVWPKKGTVWDMKQNKTRRGVNDLREIPVLAKLLDQPQEEINRIHNERVDEARLALEPLPGRADDRPPWEE